MIKYRIRSLLPSDQPILWEMLYHSLYVAEGSAPFPKNVIENPELAKYVEKWGNVGDIGFLAIESATDHPIGAVWLRLLSGDQKGYGYLDDETPELGIAVLPKYRGRGVGSNLLRRLLSSSAAVYQRISLSVSFNNPALGLYERLGFEKIETDGSSVTMVKLIRS